MNKKDKTHLIYAGILLLGAIVIFFTKYKDNDNNNDTAVQSQSVNYMLDGPMIVDEINELYTDAVLVRQLRVQNSSVFNHVEFNFEVYYRMLVNSELFIEALEEMRRNNVVYIPWYLNASFLRHTLNSMSIGDHVTLICIDEALNQLSETQKVALFQGDQRILNWFTDEQSYIVEAAWSAVLYNMILLITTAE